MTALTPLAIFLLGCAAVYVGTVTAAFSALMQLSRRIMAEGSGSNDRLVTYLDDPRCLFIPVRLLLGLISVSATALIARITGVDPVGLPLLAGSMAAFVLITEHVIPLAFVRRDPQRVLNVLLPSFDAVARLLSPLTHALLRVGTSRRAARTTTPNHHTENAVQTTDAAAPAGDSEPLQERQARAMLRSLVDFRETMVREVMTPRPDIVGVEAEATIGQLQQMFREQQYSRVPVFQDTLDNVTGFVFVKDLIHQSLGADPAAAIAPLVRPANFVPETKRVVELLREFQRDRLQMAIVVDEYGGTAGLVTVEDLLEEIVGEIRDEYDVEVEPVVDEGEGRFVFSGKAHVQELTERMGIAPGGEGFETVGGFLLSRLGRVPTVGEHFDIDGLTVEVLEAERRRITRVRIAPAAADAAPETAGATQ
ncbi:MAG: HlyC/CorC family transporter [Acidobacteria bacterium]|nr:HlyC/CorC family transporter [Acidobacteriota bacterium]